MTSTNNPYEAFYHGLVTSKIWLCEELEKELGDNIPSVNILGGWHNLMSFIMLVRKPKSYKEINSYDKDPQATEVAYKICDTWRVEEPKVYNHTIDASELDFSTCTNTVFINCSVDQFNDDKWYKTIPNGSLVCLQTTDIIDDNPPWEINQKTRDITDFLYKYPVDDIIYTGSKRIKYGDNKYYNRLMIIGYK